MNKPIIDEENLEIFMSDTNVFYSDELASSNESDAQPDNSDELTEKDFENDYFSGSDNTQLLDDIKEEEEEIIDDEETFDDDDMEDTSTKKRKSYKKESHKVFSYNLLDELMQAENYRVRRKFYYRGEKYKGYVVAKLSSNRFVFNILPDNKLKAINIDEVKLI